MKSTTKVKVMWWILGTLGVGGILLTIGIALMSMIVVGIIVASSGASTGVMPLPNQDGRMEIPLKLLPIYLQAENKRVSWAALAAIHEVTTEFGQNTSSGENAIGFVGFPPRLWYAYKMDGDADGTVDPENPFDAIFSLAYYLKEENDRTNQALETFLSDKEKVDQVLERERDYHSFLFIVDAWLWPVIGQPMVSSPYGSREDPITGTINFHQGLDIPAVKGTPVLSIRDGTVIIVANDPEGFGHHIRIQHAGYQSLYAHLSAIGVKTGQQVSQGEMIGWVGSTGRSTGPHLHLEIHKDGNLMDPSIKWFSVQDDSG